MYLADGHRPLKSTFEVLPRLKYTLMVVQEAMRLYPPACAMTRAAIKADEIGGYRVPANSEMLLLPYITHRHPKYWEKPEEFYPEHFLAEKVAARPRFAYFPLGGGPRQCIGNNFALVKAQIIIATVAQKYRLQLADEGETNRKLPSRSDRSASAKFYYQQTGRPPLKPSPPLRPVLLLCALFAMSIAAQAQGRYTFVSMTDSDANDCISATTTCRTFQRAHDVVNDGGTVVARDSGGYGPIAITKSVTITGEGVEAGLTVTGAGVDGVSINTAGG
jgi:hypothetical protein